MLCILLFFSIRVPLNRSCDLNKKFEVAPGALDYPLEVEITDEHKVSASRV